MTNPFETIDLRLSNIENLLLDLKHAPNDFGMVTSAGDQWFDLDGLIDYDPGRRSKATFYKLTGKREIPFYKPAKKLLFLKSEIDSWLKTSRKKTVEEISSEANTYLKKKGRRNV